MFEQLSSKLDDAFRKLSGKAVLSEDNIKEGLRDVRRALLEADVNFKVAKDFIKAVEEKAVGRDVLKGVNPTQQIVKVEHADLV